VGSNIVCSNPIPESLLAVTVDVVGQKRKLLQNRIARSCRLDAGGGLATDTLRAAMEHLLWLKSRSILPVRCLRMTQFPRRKPRS
jgi:hypothetical protein